MLTMHPNVHWKAITDKDIHNNYKYMIENGHSWNAVCDIQMCDIV